MRLKNKLAIVTGGSRGIGAATALKLAEEGADVAITFSSSKEKAEKVAAAIIKLGRKAFIIQADANEPTKVAQAVDDAAKALGGLDILVNNAGVFEAGGVIGAIDATQFEHQLNVNVRSVFAATQAAVAHLKAGGRIVNVSSCLGERAIMPSVSAYTMTKFAVALRESLDSGVAGVIGSVAGLLTGAAGAGGFKGLGGRHSRRNLLQFGVAGNGNGSVAFARRDTNAAVDCTLRLEMVPTDPRLGSLLGVILNGTANTDDTRQFRNLWQERVARLLIDHANDPDVVQLHRCRN